MPKANKLAREASPYLRSHSTHPVNWYPWGSDALNKARRGNLPIFLSIGYSACHWCHVMAQESFENPATAEILNRHFVSIKVDREERPEIDSLYMAAVQALTQRGGWPLSVFLTPDGKPFYGGTYFPPEPTNGQPSFSELLVNIATAWKTRRDQVTESAQALTLALETLHLQQATATAPPQIEWIENAVEEISKTFDPQHGGIGTAPKFFHTASLRLCLRHAVGSGDNALLDSVTRALNAIYRGAVCDPIGGGFHRYATDAQWRVPHYEKLLCDNALLAELFLEGYQATGVAAYAAVARSTLDYVLRELAHPEGGFFCSQSAGTDGDEGAFYKWNQAEVLNVLGKDLGALAVHAFGLNTAPTPEHRQALFIQAPPEGTEWAEEQLATAKRKLLLARNERTRPFRDEKVLVSWNGLMMHALARGFMVLGEHRYLEAAQGCMSFIFDKLISPHPLSDGKLRLLHSYAGGTARFNGVLDDYAFLLQGLNTLYLCDFSPDNLAKAKAVAHSMLDQFWEPEKAALFLTGKDHETLILRPSEAQDGALPSGQSVAAVALWQLGCGSAEGVFEDCALSLLHKQSQNLLSHPTAFSQLAIATRASLNGLCRFTLQAESGSPDLEMALAIVRSRTTPEAWIACEPLPREKNPVSLELCVGETCVSSLSGVDAIEQELPRWTP